MTAWLALFFGIQVGSAQVAIPAVFVTAEPADVDVLYRFAAETAGLDGPALTPACRAWSAFFAMCFMVEEDGARRLIHQGDLEEWQVDDAELEELARSQGLSLLSTFSGHQVGIADLKDDAYWLFEGENGLASTALLYPEWMVDRVGEGMVLAIPSRGRVVAWVPGDEEVDRVIAIGIRRLYEQAQIPVSSVIVRWNGQAWVRWGEAQARP